jgi:uncharacterized protein DUF6285
MQDRPTAIELLEAGAEFLEREVAPVCEGALRYKAKVVANVLRIVGREIDLGERHLREEAEDLAALLAEARPRARGERALREEVVRLNRLLGERIRTGEMDSGVGRSRILQALRKMAVRKLEIANPRYLELARSRSSPKPLGSPS